MLISATNKISYKYNSQVMGCWLRHCSQRTPRVEKGTTKQSEDLLLSSPFLKFCFPFFFH